MCMAFGSFVQCCFCFVRQLFNLFALFFRLLLVFLSLFVYLSAWIIGEKI